MEPINNCGSFNLTCNYNQLPIAEGVQETPEVKKADKPKKTDETKKSGGTSNVVHSQQAAVAPQASAAQDTSSTLQVVLGFVSQLLDKVLSIFQGLLGGGAQNGAITGAQGSQNTITAAPQASGGSKEGGFSLGNIFSGIGNAIGGLFGGGDSKSGSETATKDSGGSSAGGIIGSLGSIVSSFF